MTLGGGLLQAVVLLTPTFTWARSVVSSTLTPAHLVSPVETASYVDIYLGDNVDPYKSSEFLLRLDLLDSEDAPCDASRITLDGRPLTQDEDGLDQGSFETGHGFAIGATWALECHEPGQDGLDKLTFKVDSIDHVAVRGVEFELKFKRDPPLEIESVDGLPYLIKLPQVPFHSPESDDLEAQLAEVEKIKAHLSDLENEIALKQQSSRPYNEWKQAPIFAVRPCDTVKCKLNRYFNHMVKNIGETVQPVYPGQNKDTQQKSMGGYMYSDNNVQKTLGNSKSNGLVHSDKPIQHPIQYHQPSMKIKITSDDRRYYALLIALVVTAIMVVGISIGLSYASYRCTGARRECCLARRQRREQESRYHEQVNEKPAEPTTTAAAITAVRATAAVALSWIQTSLQRRKVGDEEKDAMSRQEADTHPNDNNDLIALRVAIPPHPPHFPHHPTTEMPPSRWSFAGLPSAESDSEDESDRLSTTMEQELAQFRAVAGFVENIVAAGSLRGSSSATAKQRQRGQSSASSSSGRSWRPRTPPSPTTTLPSYHSDEEAPPGYESGPDDEPREFVADGFQHTPGNWRWGPGAREGEDGGDGERTLPPMAGESTLDEHLGRKE